MDESERKMLEEIALRNAVSRFRRINKAKTKKASTPEVGLFWCDDSGTLFAKTAALTMAEDYGDFRILDKAHIDVWNIAVRVNEKWAGMEYEEVPRGRVVYRRDPKKPEFIVYMPRRIKKFKSKVLARFHLPVGYVRVDHSDEHYSL